MRSEIALVFLVGFAVLLFALFFGRGRIKKAQLRLSRLRGLRTQECQTIRAAARQTLQLRRQLVKNKAEQLDLERNCEELLVQIREREAIDRRLYVLDERRTNADLSWIAVVCHPDYGRLILPGASRRAIKSWQVGRKFVVWAIDEPKALQKLSSKLPESQGYVLMSLIPKPERADRAGAVPAAPAMKAPAGTL